MKKKYKLLTILKKIKKNSLFNSLGTLNNEKNKLENVNLELQKLLDSCNFKEGSVITSSQLKNLKKPKTKYSMFWCEVINKKIN